MVSKQAFYRSKKVLVIEDYEQVIAYMKSMLALIGFDHVVVARNAETAMSACRKTDFDFILCDYNLGVGRDGYQLFEALKAEHSLKHSCCFIVVSGERHRQAVYGMIEFLPDDYLLKPFSYAELERRIGRAFQVKRALKYAYQMIAEENYPEAIQACDVALEQYPLHHAYINRLKGELLVKVGRFKDAEDLYTQVLEFRDLPWAKLGIAVAKGYQDQDTEAEDLLTELVNQPETRIEALDWLTRLYLSQNKTEEAFNTVRIVAEASPKNYLRQHVLANLAVINNQPDLAVRIHSKLLEAAKYSMYDTADNMLNYARAMIQNAQDMSVRDRRTVLGKVDYFLKDVKKRFNPATYEHDKLVIEARAAVLEGKTEKAKSLLQQSEELSLGKTLSPSALLDRARAYFESGNLAMSDHYMGSLNTLSQSSDLYNKALNMMFLSEQDKYSSKRATMMASHNAGMEAYSLGQYSEAINYFIEAQKTMPANASIAMNLLQAISQRGRLNEDLIYLAHKCMNVIDDAELPKDQRKRYQFIKEQIQQML
ncbi:response regulator [Rheinheimera sp.]|uniref:response regulator n=1 Tax=Rheinheimera sp. TaxID=1869214 RepID=UPI002610227E|nr:response regulator [Rheinheimera sp.]MCA1929375.1 response regulator [Rheinheimera sp.]